MQPDPSILKPRLARLPLIVAGFTTRRGGISREPYDSLNLGLSTGDDEDRVRSNREVALNAVGISAEQMAVAGQVHGTDVRVVDAPGLYSGYDALVTAEPDVALAITAADCAAVLFADPEARVIGACHSGWRGTVGNIVGRAVDTMRSLGAKPARMAAYVSPCISQAHFEVGPEVAEQFHRHYVATPAQGEKPHVDLKAAIADQLVDAGISASSVEVSRHCTVEDRDVFFSYRAEGGRTGRMMGFIMMQGRG